MTERERILKSINSYFKNKIHKRGIYGPIRYDFYGYVWVEIKSFGYFRKCVIQTGAWHWLKDEPLQTIQMVYENREKIYNQIKKEFLT